MSLADRLRKLAKKGGCRLWVNSDGSASVRVGEGESVGHTSIEKAVQEAEKQRTQGYCEEGQ